MAHKKILFIDGDSNEPDQLRAQILNEIKSALPVGCEWEDSERDAEQIDALTVSLFPTVPADILLMFDLSDRNHFLRSDSDDRPLVSTFKKILVPGNWLRDQILANPRLALKPENVIAVGSPRIDMLCRLQAQLPVVKTDPDTPPRVLFAQMPSNWRDSRGELMDIPQDKIAETIALLGDSYDVTAIQDQANGREKVPITAELLAADIVITDYASVMYEAWALGKPVIFPRWLTGDRVLTKAPKSAEAYVYQNRIGHHPDSLIEMFDLMDRHGEVGLGDGVDAFMADYRSHHQSAGAAIAEAFDSQANMSQVVAKYRIEKSLKAAIAQKEWHAALSHTNDLIAITPKDPALFNQRAQFYNKLEDTALEVAALQTALSFSSKSAEWWNRLGAAHVKLNNNQQAAQAWAKAIALKPALGTSEMYYKLGYAYETPSLDPVVNTVAAKEAYALACAKTINKLAAKYGVGMLHSAVGRWQEARIALEPVSRAMPMEAELYYHLGMTHDRDYNWAQAEACYFRALSLKQADTAWHFRLGFVRERQGNFDGAAQAYMFAASKSKSHKPKWFYRAGYVLEKAGRLQEACAAYLNVAPQEAADETQQGTYLSSFTQEYWALQREVLDHQPNNADLWFAYSKKLHLIGDVKGAYQASEKAVMHAKVVKKEFQAWYNKLAEQARRTSSIKMRLDYNCTYAAHWNAYSLALAEMGDVDGAITALQQALARSNTHQTKWYNRLGALLTKQDRLEDACDAFRSQHILQRPHGTWEAKFTQSEELRETATYREFHDTLPMMTQTVLYESFSGEGCSDNPLAMFNQIQNDPRFKGWLHIWSIRGEEKIPPTLRNRQDVVFVEKDSTLYQRYLATVPYLINNATFPFYYTRRDGQHYLNTWHGTPLKTLGYDVAATPLQRANTARNLIQASMFIAPNEHTEKVMIDRYGVRNLFTGTSMISGYPRIDMLINATKTDKSKICKDLGLDPTKPIILFAPTYRGHWATPELEAQSLAESLERLKSPHYNLVFRGHYFAEKFINEMNLDVNIAPHSIDTCSLLSVVDVLITDYSSIFYDFLITKRPIIHYVHDWDYYVETRGMYFEKDDLPGLICEDEDSLVEAVERCCANPKAQITPKYLADLKRYCSHEDGKASERVVQALFFDLPPKPVHAKRATGVKHFVFHAGACNTGPKLRNLRGFTAATKAAGHINTVLVDRYAIINNDERTDNTQSLLPQTDVVMRFGRFCMSLEESWIESKIKTATYTPPQAILDAFAPALAFEMRRFTGCAHFDAAIDLNVRNSFWTRIFSKLNSKTHIAQLGGDFTATSAALPPKLKNNKALFADYDKLLSYTPNLSEINKRSLNFAQPDFTALPPFVDADVVIEACENDASHHHIVCFTADPDAFLKQAPATKATTSLTLFVPPAVIAQIWQNPLVSEYYDTISVLSDTHDSLSVMKTASLVVFPQGTNANYQAFTEASALGLQCLVIESENQGAPNALIAPDLPPQSLVQKFFRNNKTAKNTAVAHNAKVFKQFSTLVKSRK